MGNHEQNKSSNVSKSVGNDNTAQIMVSLLSGAGAGALCTILCAPFDVAKVRLQIQGTLPTKKYKGSVFQVISRIYKDEGIRGIFRGVGPALFTVPLFWGVYWPIYDRMKAYFSESLPEVSEKNPAILHLSAAITAGAVGDIIANPFWVTRTRIQTLIFHSDQLLAPVSSCSTYSMMRKIYTEEGFLAFYKGIAASFLGLSHVAIQFPLYEYLKALARERSGSDTESFTDLLLASTIAKLIASTVTYPHEVIRARMQDTRSFHKPSITSILRSPGVVQVCKELVQREGVLALWTGLQVNLYRIVPATVATFVSYEYITRYLRKVYGLPAPK